MMLFTYDELVSQLYEVVEHFSRRLIDQYGTNITGQVDAFVELERTVNDSCLLQALHKDIYDVMSSHKMFDDVDLIYTKLIKPHVWMNVKWKGTSIDLRSKFFDDAFLLLENLSIKSDV